MRKEILEPIPTPVKFDTNLYNSEEHYRFCKRWGEEVDKYDAWHLLAKGVLGERYLYQVDHQTSHITNEQIATIPLNLTCMYGICSDAIHIDYAKVKKSPKDFLQENDLWTDSALEKNLPKLIADYFRVCLFDPNECAFKADILGELQKASAKEELAREKGMVKRKEEDKFIKNVAVFAIMIQLRKKLIEPLIENFLNVMRDRLKNDLPNSLFRPINAQKMWELVVVEVAKVVKEYYLSVITAGAKVTTSQFALPAVNYEQIKPSSVPTQQIESKLPSADSCQKSDALGVQSIKMPAKPSTLVSKTPTFSAKKPFNWQLFAYAGLGFLFGVMAIGITIATLGSSAPLTVGSVVLALMHVHATHHTLLVLGDCLFGTLPIIGAGICLAFGGLKQAITHRARPMLNNVYQHNNGPSRKGRSFGDICRGLRCLPCAQQKRYSLQQEPRQISIPSQNQTHNCFYDEHTPLLSDNNSPLRPR